VSQIAGHSEELIREHPAFVALADLVGSLKTSAEEAREEKAKAEASAAQNVNQLELTKSQEIVRSSFRTFTCKANVDSKSGVKSQLQAEIVALKEKSEARAKEALKAKDQRDAANKEIAILKASDSTKHRDQESITLRAKSLEVSILIRVPSHAIALTSLSD
jgi:FtsZ-binding cell division protein ZapB